jgi:outer membrane protein
MKKRVLAIVMILSAGMTGNYTSAQSGLKEIINYSLEHSRDIKKSELQCQEAEYLHKETLANGLPQISASGSYSDMMFQKIEIPESLTSMIPAEYQEMVTPILDQINGLDRLYSVSAGVTATQLIYSQAYIEGLKTTRKTKELYSLLKTKSEEDVMAEVASSYYQTGSMMLQLETLDKSIKNLKEVYRIAELTYKNDMLKESNVNRLKVTITNLEVTRKTLQDGITIQLNYIKALAGMPADTTITIDVTPLVNDDLALKRPADFSINNVPSYQALLKQDDLYGQQVKLARAKYFPTLAAFDKFSYSSYSLENNFDRFNHVNTLGLSLSVPIFTSGANHYKVKQNILKQAQLREDINKTKDLLTVSYNNAFLEYQSACDLLIVQKENRELAQKVYDQTALQYNEGMASMADLLNVNSDFLQADNSYNQQVLKCKTAEIKMLKASGNMKSILE